MPAETVDAYMARNSIKPVFSDLLDSICRDTPDTDTLTPYLLSKLAEMFPAAAATVEIEATAKAWKEYKKMTIVNRMQLDTYLADLRWKDTSQALLERVLYERPKNVPAFMIELLAKGDVAPAGPPELDEGAAAIKMQSLQRGRKARKDAKKRKKVGIDEGGEVVVPQAADASEQVDNAAAQMQEEAEEAVAEGLMDEFGATKMEAIAAMK